MASKRRAKAAIRAREWRIRGKPFELSQRRARRESTATARSTEVFDALQRSDKRVDYTGRCAAIPVRVDAVVDHA